METSGFSIDFSHRFFHRVTGNCGLLTNNSGIMMDNDLFNGHDPGTD